MPMSWRPTRDFVGYGANPPDPKWPNGARMAMNFVMNYEEGSEASIPDGDETERLKRWGYRLFRDLFNSRQLLGLGLLAREIAEVPDTESKYALATAPEIAMTAATGASSARLLVTVPAATSWPAPAAPDR